MNNSSNVLLAKSFAFGVRVFKLSHYLQQEQREFMVSKQLMRNGTAIGANAEEAMGGISKADFSLKISIAYEEVRKTSYWLRLLRAADCLDERQFDSIHPECQELCKILCSILRTSGRTN